MTDIYYIPSSLETTEPNYSSLFINIVRSTGRVDNSRSNTFTEGNRNRTQCKQSQRNQVDELLYLKYERKGR